MTRHRPTLDEAMAALMQRPSMTLSEFAELNNLNRMTVAKAVEAGEVVGAFKIGRQIRIATAPWRAKLGLDAEHSSEAATRADL